MQKKICVSSFNVFQQTFKRALRVKKMTNKNVAVVQPFYPILKYMKLSPAAYTPTRATNYSAGLDFYSLYDTVIPVNGLVKIHTGIALELPPYTVETLLGRSSKLLEGVFVYPGVIDSDFRGELQILARTNLDVDHTIKCGEKIAQLVITPILIPVLCEATELSVTIRGCGGFGSSN